MPDRVAGSSMQFLSVGSHVCHPAPDREVERLIEETERKLGTGRFFGIGEFIVRHWAYSPGPHAEQENPIYSTFMQRMSAIAARFREQPANILPARKSISPASRPAQTRDSAETGRNQCDSYLRVRRYKYTLIARSGSRGCLAPDRVTVNVGRL